MKNILPAFVLVSLFWNSNLAFSQIKKDTLILSELIVKASPIHNSLQNNASSISIVTATDINKSDGIMLTPVLNKIAGVYMQQGALNTNRITIRGIGARTQFGTSRVKAYLDNIPLSSGEGETVIEDIDMGCIDKIEVIKGPNSTSFGAGLGGVIHLFSKETPLFESFAKSTSTYGSFGSVQQRLSAGYSNNNLNLFSSYSDLQSTGFRANSSYSRKSYNLFGKQKISLKGTLSFIGIFTRLKAFIPSSINETDFKNNPKRAASNWLAAQGYESYDKYVLGLGYNHQFSEKWTLKSSVFSNIKNAYEARPFDILEDETNTLGARLNLNYKDKLFRLPFEFSIGTEFSLEKYNYSLFKNLYLSSPGKGSVQGDQFSAVSQNRNYSDYFFQLNIWLSKKLSLETGIGLNATKYSTEDDFNPTLTKEKSSHDFGDVWSPRVGLSYKIAHGKNIFVSVNRGFSNPSVAETLTPEGEINTELKSEMGLNYELGFKGNWNNNKLYTEITFFSTQIKNLLVARRIAEDQYVGINAGASSHTGIEFFVNYKMLEAGKIYIDPYFSGAINNFKFKDFVDGNFDYSGNHLTGVPENQFNLGLDVRLKNNFSLNSSYRYVGKIPLNDSNSKYSENYTLLDLKVTYKFKVLKFINIMLNSGVNNLLNEKYASNILPNAVGFGNAAPRYYYPGNPVNYYGEFSVSYLF